MSGDLSWQNAKTLSEWVVSVIEREGLKAPELVPLRELFGEKKIETIWQEHLERGKKIDGNPS